MAESSGRAGPSASSLYRLAFLNFFGWYLITPILPLYLTTLTDNAAAIGVVIASASVLPLILAYPLGILADRLPAHALGVIGTAGMVAVAAGFALGRNITTAAVAQSLHGLSQLAIVLTIQTALAKTGSASFTTLYGHYTFWASTGQTVSPLLAGISASWLITRGLLPGQSYQAVFGGAAVVFAGACALAWRLPRNPPDAGRSIALQVRSTARVLRGEGMVSALIASAGIVFAFDVRRSFYPIYLRELGLTPAIIGALFSILALSAAMVRPFLGHICRLVSPARLLIGVLLGGALGWMGVTLSPSWTVLGAAAVLCGVTQGFGHPLTMSVVAGAAPVGMGGTALGIRQFFNQMGQLLSPLVLGLAVSRVGRTASAFVGAAAVLVIVAGVVQLAPPSRELR